MVPTELRFIHFNDVYHVPSAELFSRFIQLKESFVGDGALTLFSGDAFSPSLEASILKGEHMGPLLNFAGVDVACYGNHGLRTDLSDFDFGDARLIELSNQVDFPWVLSNAWHVPQNGQWLEEGELLGRAKSYVVRELHGFRIGFFGLAGT
ncbi:2,3-cyclic-nucleotide 2-phosphodiesterase [Aspergillus sclerotialis]|uniref:2,3-cyclic-nucleotide 2-phosphodiesterase n=1 Tax=Aspergillus sclerotialis TaxID=2070753 RepID=A0A3A2ZL04_9EURO|nr:2,3-cyclic-nucleotide 2-phosphodiesterase [Aspergillus sclerotialis]